MGEMFDATWRAAAYCLHPRVLLWSLLPLALLAGAVFGLAWVWWEPWLAGLQALLEGLPLLAALFEWADEMGLPDLRPLLPPLISSLAGVPAVVMLTLVLVALLMTPAMVRLVVQRRFPDLQCRAGRTAGRDVAGWTAGCVLFALLALLLSVPLWFVPPLILLLPPLIWGWLCVQVLAFDALARHAGTAERRFILHRRRWPLRLVGLVFGVLAALPTLLWTEGAMTRVLSPVLMALAVGAYVLVFSYASLWFAHYTLAALHRLRGRAAVVTSLAAADQEAHP